ncbi:unnamed protein product, partial [Iphiclides podalirius]
MPNPPQLSPRNISETINQNAIGEMEKVHVTSANKGADKSGRTTSRPHPAAPCADKQLSDICLEWGAVPRPYCGDPVTAHRAINPGLSSKAHDKDNERP